MKRPAIAAVCLTTCIAALCLALAGCGGESETKLIASAQAFLDKDDARSALIQLKSALQKNPKSGTARLLLARALRETGDPAAALVELRKAQELNVPDEQLLPEMARTMLLVGESAKVAAQYAATELREPRAAADLAASVATAFAMQNDKAQALASSNRALQAVPGYAPAIVLQAQLKAADRDVDGALFLLDDVLAKDAGNLRAATLKGELQWRGKRDPDAALATYRQALTQHPQSVAARIAIIAILFEQDKTAEGRAELAALKKLAPNHPDTVFLEARAAFLDKNYQAVRELTGRVLKSLPDNVPALELAGAAEYRLKGDQQAETLLNRALKLAPHHVLPRQLLAQTYLRSGQATRAVELLQPLVDSPQADGLTLALAGEAYLQAGDAQRSDEAFRRAAQVAPQDTRVRTSVAIGQIARGATESAFTELEHIAAEDQSPRSDLALISGRLRQKDLAGAAKAVEALRRKMPGNPLPDLLNGRILALRKDNAGAAAAFQAALAKDPTYFPAVASLSALDLAANKPDAARQRFEALVKADPRNHRAWLALAELASRAGSPPAEMLRLLNEAVKAAPEEPAPRVLLVNHQLQAGDAKAALQAAQDAAAVLPNSNEVMDALGRAQLAAGDGQQALSTFKKLASLQPKNAQVQLRLAEAYAAGQDADGGRAALKRALEIDPLLLPAYRGLASLALTEKHPDEALAVARELQTRAPKNGAGFALEGDIEASRRNWPAAANALRAAWQRGHNTETAVALHRTLVSGGQRAEADRLAADWQREQPKDATFRYYLGDMALARKDFAAADAHYRAVLEMQPRNALALNNVAWLMVQQGQRGAVEMADKANALMPDRAPLLDTLATALAAENQLPRAIETQKKAIERNPQDPGLRLNLARIYVKAGDKTQARSELQNLAKLGDKFARQAEVAELLKTL